MFIVFTGCPLINRWTTTTRARLTSLCREKPATASQRKRAGPFHEEQEDGVSGHKVRAENRDKLQIIKEHAHQGKQRFDNHTDKLTNYIRFWQADGESEKTSIRTKTALGQLVEDGGFKGGMAPYGYDLVKNGRVNKRKHELYELAVNEAEAAVVRIIFEKYVN